MSKQRSKKRKDATRPSAPRHPPKGGPEAKLAAWLAANGVTQAELARTCKVSRAAINAFLAGHTPAGPRLAAAIEAATGGAITAAEACFDAAARRHTYRESWRTPVRVLALAAAALLTGSCYGNGEEGADCEAAKEACWEQCIHGTDWWAFCGEDGPRSYAEEQLGRRGESGPVCLDICYAALDACEAGFVASPAAQQVGGERADSDR